MKSEDLRAAVADFRLAYRLHPEATGQALSNAASVFDRLAEPDSAIAVLQEGMGRSPVLGEELGLRLLVRGDYEAARSALRAALTDLRAHSELGDDPEPQIQEAYAAALIRLAWLAEGRPAAFAATASLEPVVRNSLPVRFAVCLAKDVEPIDYALRTRGGLLSRDLQQARETPEVDACIALLAH